MKALHEHFQDNVKYSCSVGATHQAEQKDFNIGDMSSFPGAKPTFFFAPTQAQKRTEEWGPGEVQKRIGLSLIDFQQYSHQWMSITRGHGIEAIEDNFTKVVQDKIAPTEGLILSV